MDYYCYIVRTSRGDLYTGIATDVEARVARHNAGKGSKCLRGQLPVTLVWRSEQPQTRSKASKAEYEIKNLTAAEKAWFIRLHTGEE